MSWHGNVLFYRRNDSHAVDGICDIANREVDRPTLIIAHIVNNSNRQDIWAASMIIQATVARVCLFPLQGTKMCIFSNNARTYRNDIIPVVAPVKCKAHSFQLHGFIYPETAHSKTLVDAHFGIVMRHVHRLVKQTQLDVTTPEDLVCALHHDGEFRSAQRSCSQYTETIIQWRNGDNEYRVSTSCHYGV